MEKLIKQMMVSDPFYGFFLTTLDRHWSSSVERIGVRFNKSLNAELIVNKEWFNQWDDEVKINLIKHELLHLAFKHIILSRDFPITKLFNIAADLEINSYLGKLPPEGCFCKDFNFPEKQGTAWYYRKLIERQQQQQAKGRGSGIKQHDKPLPGSTPTDQQNQQQEQEHEQDDRQESQQQDEPEQAQKDNQQSQLSQSQQQDMPDTEPLDDHSIWEDCQSAVTQEVVGGLIDDMLMRSANSTKGCGHIPGELEQIIADLNKPMEPVFNWRKMFRRFLGNAYTENVKRSHRKESRRYPDAAGAQHTKRSNVLVAIDTSGSVSEHELREFVSELTYMHKAGTHIHVLECDADISREYDFKPGCIKGVTGRGGTDFHPVINYYTQRYKQYETLIYFTDGGASLDLRVPQNNMLWVISSKGLHQDYPGKVLYIPKPQNNQ